MKKPRILWAGKYGNWAVQYVRPISNAASSCKIFESWIIRLI